MDEFLEKIISDLRKDFDTKLLAVQKKLQLELYKTDEKIIEIETTLKKSKNVEPMQVTGCIFFADTQDIFTDIDDESKILPYGPFFLQVPYENFQTYLHKNFEGAGFTYQLKPNYQFVEAEQKLFRLSQLYKTAFQIYSPYARRAVDIRIVDKSREDFLQLGNFNFRLAENNLDDKLLMNEKIYWNVKIKRVSEQWRRKVEDLYQYGYTDGIDDSTYILPNNDANFDDELEPIKSEGQIIMRTPREFPEGDCERVKILPIENKITPRILSKARLRTQGDIESVLKDLARENYSCRFGKFGEVGKRIKLYTKEHKYLTSADENLLRAKMKLPVCSVKFSGEEIFLTDYANYVLNFLSERYPEFNWAGELDE